MRLRAAFVGCLLAGCGSISDNGNNIDAGADMTGPMVKSSSPANMETKAPIITPISVNLDEALDESTVTAENVKVTYLPLAPLAPYLIDFDIYWANAQPIYLFGPQPVTGTVSYDDAASHKLSFVPAAPLPYGVTVTVDLTGVKDKAGNAFAGTPVKFVTYANSQATRFSFNSTSSAPASWQEFGPDTNGRISMRTNRSNAGTDGIWHTADDNVSQLIKFSVAADGRILDERGLSAGPDAMLGTSDDVTNDFFKYSYDAMNRLTERYETTDDGDDDTFGTSDDLPAFVQTWEYDAMGRLVGGIMFDDKGTDMAFRTPDDRCSIRVEWQYDAMGRKTRDLFKSCGADSQPKNADDEVLQYKDYEYDANGLVVSMTTLTGAGDDMTFFTADDTGFSRIKFERNPRGVAQTITTFYDPGADGKWRTADDLIGQIEKDTLDEHGLVTTQDFYSAGSDGMFNTADDVVNSYITTSYDGNGNRQASKNYILGPDGVAHTADDRFTSVTNFSTAH